VSGFAVIWIILKSIEVFVNGVYIGTPFKAQACGVLLFVSGFAVIGLF
jgi:inner membrane protein involved in colicin E2 resistance